MLTLQEQSEIRLLGATPNISLWDDCNFYKENQERGAGGNLQGSYGYIEQCGGTCDGSKTVNVGQCGSTKYANCDGLCRNHSPFPSRHAEDYCVSSAALCKRKREDFTTVKNGTSIDCCSFNDLATLMNMDCPPDMYQGSEGCAVELLKWCAVGDNIKDIRCNQLKTSKPDLWKRIASEYCTGNGNADGRRFGEAFCQSFCQENRTTCEPALDKLCDGKDPNNNEWSKICGCHYNNSVYTNFSNSMDTKWMAPAGTFYGARVCVFPQCKDAWEGYQQLQKQACPVVSVTSCLQAISIDARGAVINGGSVIPTQVQNCGNALKPRPENSVKCTTTKDCGALAGTICMDGYCTASASPSGPCKEDKDCTGTNQTCIGGACVAKSVPASGGGLPKWLIILLVVVAALLLLGGIVFAVLKQQKPKNVAPIQSVPRNLRFL